MSEQQLGPEASSPAHLFQQFELESLILQGLKQMNFSTPTPIQAQALGPALAGRDILGQAQTGSGKTAAFSIPMVQRLLKNPQEKALILVPTRELAVQVSDMIFKLISGRNDLRPAQFIGGVDMQRQIRSLRRNPRILVATPGRLNDHIRSGTIRLDQVKILVLDEADRMLDMGFAPQIETIIAKIPREGRQSFLFSATFPKNMVKLAANYLVNPVKISTMSNQQAIPRIENQMVQTTVAGKKAILVDELTRRDGPVLIFARTKIRTDRLARDLHQLGHPVTMIHGDRTQGQRNKAIAGFRSGEFRILVATDVAARGLDINNIAHVINYDLPDNCEDFIHRIGRTARAGAEGKALSFVAPDEQYQWKQIAKLIKQKTQGQETL